eukprot:1193633-Prorocentrum_minimum.AAC.5
MHWTGGRTSSASRNVSSGHSMSLSGRRPEERLCFQVVTPLTLLRSLLKSALLCKSKIGSAKPSKRRSSLSVSLSRKASIPCPLGPCPTTLGASLPFPFPFPFPFPAEKTLQVVPFLLSCTTASPQKPEPILGGHLWRSAAELLARRERKPPVTFTARVGAATTIGRCPPPAGRAACRRYPSTWRA